MGKKGIALLAISCIFCSNLFCQTDSAKVYVHKGLLRAALTYSVGRMSAIALSNVYITGNIEYYTDSKLSVRGDAYYFITSLNNNHYLNQNHQLYFGACYNFQVRSHINPFIGFQPGIAYIRLNPLYGTTDPATFNPLASVVMGINYYADRWFHIMLNVRYTAGEHLDEVSLFTINELSFSFGLGWDINVLKEEK